MYDLRKNIHQIQSELNDLDEHISEIPEMIDSSNLLRLNNFLSKSNEKKSNLISQYIQYSTYLEQLISSVFEIQTDLKNILIEQTSMIKPKTKPKT